MPERSARHAIAISGAGIAGLTTALTLARKGFQVLVLEKHARLSTAGAGIQLSPNASKILIALGLGHQLKAAAIEPLAVEINSGVTGEKLSKFQLGPKFRHRHGAPYLVLHRADLLRILLTACRDNGSIEIRYNRKVTDVANHRNGVTIQVHRGYEVDEIQALALIVADGVWSKLRKQVPTAATPQFAGHIAWRTLIPMTEVNEDVPRKSTGLWLAPNAHLVHYPVRGGKMLNVVAILPWHQEEMPEKGWISEAGHIERSRQFEFWHPAAAEILNSSTAWGGWPVYSVDQVTKTTDRHVCMIGDAAHAMLPYAAQGGAASIEDAAIVAELCARNRDALDTAFEEFWQVREDRLNKVTQAAYLNRKIYHLSDRRARIRDRVLKYTPQFVLQRRLDWLYGWEG